MTSFWSEAYGCQEADCYELLKALLRAREEIVALEAARFLGYDLEVIQPLLQRLVDDGAALVVGQGSSGFYRWRTNSQLVA
jgi:hypothetical protein